MFIFIQKVVHPFSLHATSRETHTLVTRARLKSFRPPHVTCARISRAQLCVLSSCVRSCVHKMASNSPTKSVASSPYKDVHGYIHSVSEIQIPANPKSARYFDFTIQENQEDTRVICKMSWNEGRKPNFLLPSQASAHKKEDMATV